MKAELRMTSHWVEQLLYHAQVLQSWSHWSEQVTRDRCAPDHWVNTCNILPRPGHQPPRYHWHVSLSLISRHQDTGWSVWRQSGWSKPWQEMTLRRLSDSRITQAEVSCSQTLTMLWLWFKLRNIISHLRPSFTSQQEQIELCLPLVDILYSDSIDAFFLYFDQIYPLYIMTVAFTTVTKILLKVRKAF